MNKKLRKSLIFSIVLTVFAVVMATSLTFAWLYVNRTLGQSGMSLEVKVSPNLIIAEDTATIQTLKADSADCTVVRIADNTGNFLSCTRYLNNVAQSKMYFVKNTSIIDRATGLKKASATDDLVYLEVGQTNANLFYIDKTVYISSADTELTNVKLVATLDILTDTHTSSDTESYLSGSVDFSLSNTFVGTLNLAGKDAQINNGTATKTSLDIVLPSNQVPSNIKHEYLILNLRFYFDGALLKQAGKAYVNSSSVSPNNVKFDISITAVDLG